MDILRDHNWVLSVGTFLPLAGVLVMLFIPKAEEQLQKAVALITALATLGVGVYTLTLFNYDRAGEMQFVAQTNWISVIKSTYYIGIDGISLPLYILSMVITVLVMIYSWDHIPSPGNPKAFLMLMLVLQTGMAGTFISQDLILFFVFFELVLLPMYFMIGVWGGENRQYASLKFFLYTMFGSALMLVAFLALFFKTGAESFAIPYLVENGGAIAKNTQVWIFAGMFIGFAVKVPMFPFHTWLPDAHTQAPTQGSVILAAVLLKLGTYGFIRIAIPMLPDAAREWAPYIGLLSVIGIIYGALGCLAQTDMKRLIAFSSVAHMGFVMLGISTLTSFGMNAAVFASLGLPGLAGFWGEFPAILSAYSPMEGLSETTFRIYMVIAAMGTVLAAAYLLWLFQRTAFGEPTAEFGGSTSDSHGHDDHSDHDDAHHSDIHDVTIYEWVAWTPLLIGIVLFGVMPNLLFKLIDPAVAAIVTQIGG